MFGRVLNKPLVKNQNFIIVSLQVSKPYQVINDGVVIVSFEHFSQLFLVFLLLTLNK